MSEHDTALYDAERLALIDRGRSACRSAREVERELKKMDPFLETRFIGRVDPEEAPPGVVANRWHIRVIARKNHPDSMDYYFPIAGEKGEYVDLTMKIVEDMKKANLWRPGALRELRERHEREAAAAERQAELEAEQRMDNGLYVWRAAKRVAGDGGMTARKWGRGGLKGIVGT